MPDVLFFADIADVDAGRVGGKGLSLAKMTAAGLPVPPGFVVTTDAYRRLAAGGFRLPPDFNRTVEDAYARLGHGPVAVRSSATAEDAADASFAGQQETFLGIDGLVPLLEAIERCWASLHTERAKAYRDRQGIDAAGLAMAVVVQKLVPAEVAGVLFTRDPLDPTGRRMLVEAAWGLGEVVVSGRLTPDRFRLDRESGAVVEKVAGVKSVKVTAAGEEHVAPDDQRRLCLDDAVLARLADLGRKVEAFYGDPRDVEWAFAGGQFFLLQARPITVATAAEREQVRQEVIAELRQIADPGGTVWVRYNLSEVLPSPTPMTWAIVGRLLAADGGFGAMNRDLGAKPEPALGSLSAFDLVAGRPMMNLARAPRMQFANPPFGYPLGTYKTDPRLALEPKPVLNPLGGGVLKGLFRLPATVWNLTRMMGRTKTEAATFAAEFMKDVVPPFVEEVRQAKAAPLPEDNNALLNFLDHWIDRTLVGFAREGLKATVFADLAWTGLVDLLKPRLGEGPAKAAVAELSLGARPVEGEDFASAIGVFAAGRLTRAEFLDGFGHRAAHEMELSQPRWAEDPAAVERLRQSPPSHARHDEQAFAAVVARVRAEAKLAGPADAAFVLQLDRLRTFLGLREAAKHYLLMGYALIRRAIVELDRRFGLNGGVFFLTPADFPGLLAGKDLSAKIAAARKRRQAELSLEVPAVLFSDDLEAIGRPAPEPAAGEKLEGVALSAGVAEGKALVLTEPTAPPPGEEGYVLVCPSTDPAWVPLFARAKALVMETGGVLSHGAIVAREFGLPAVAGLPDATTRLRTGQTLRVDGGRGTVTIG